MSTLSLPTITDCQHSVAGIRRLRVTQVSNYNNLGQVDPGSTIYDITFLVDSGSASERNIDSRSGSYLDQEASVYIPRRQPAMEEMRRALRDRKVAVEITDAHGEIIAMSSATILISYASGEQLGSQSGYTIDITGKRVANRINRFSLPVTGGDNDGSQDGSGGGSSVTPGDTGTPTTDTCCITIQTTLLAQVPQLMNNPTDMRNKLYRVVDGSVWMVDHLGNAMKINDAKKIETLTGGGSSFVLSYPESHTPGDGNMVIIVRGGLVLDQVGKIADFTNTNQYVLDASLVEFSSLVGSQEVVKIYYI